MKRLRQVKLSSSPHRTFLVVIHSWQKLFMLWQPVSLLMYGVVSCYHPRNVHRSPYSHVTPHLPTQAPAWFCAGYRFSLGRIWRWVWGFISIMTLIHDRENTLMGGEPQEICSRSGIQEWCLRCLNMNEEGKLMFLFSLSLCLPFCLSICYLFSFHSVSTVSLSDLAKARWEQLEMNMIANSVFPNALCKELTIVCSAVGMVRVDLEIILSFFALRIH